MRERAGSRAWKLRVAWIAAVAALLAGSQPASDFAETLARVDRALKENPGHVAPKILKACVARRNDAARLYRSGQVDRARRRLKACMQDLQVVEAAAEGPAAAEEPKEAPPSLEEIQARAAREVERALTLEPDIGRGRGIYHTCAECHLPEGWGVAGSLIPIPQLAGQHRTVLIKQLADIRAGNRDSVVMSPYATVELIGGPQAIADVAGYIDSLEMTVDNGKGPGKDLELGGRLYRDKCASCHGQAGEGDRDAYVPRIQAQHYNYLVAQFGSIRRGTRRNANPEMVAQIQSLDAREVQAVLDYVSRLEPPEDLRAPPGWRNPDFAQ